MSKQPEALRLATALDVEFAPGNCIRESDIRAAAAELRRLHALNAEMLKALVAMDVLFAPLARDSTAATWIENVRDLIASHRRTPCVNLKSKSTS